jgi:RNA polymerase sigma-70 factor (ECF subfamily)
VSSAETRDALDAFQRAADTGDLQGLLDILAPDVVFLGDGGGAGQAVLRLRRGGGTRLPACWPPGWARRAAALQPAQVNWLPGTRFLRSTARSTVLAVRIDDGLVTGLYAVRNPEKLSHMERRPRCAAESRRTSRSPSRSRACAAGVR